MKNYKNKGMLLEQLINETIDEALRKNTAILHKLEIPINVSKIKKSGNSIIVEKAYIDKKSNTDYYGIYKGYFITFEAKSTHQKNMPLSTIKTHQWEYVDKVSEHGGIAFFIFGFMDDNRYFIVDKSILQHASTRSVTIDELERFGYELELEFPGRLSILKYLDEKVKKMTKNSH